MTQRPGWTLQLANIYKPAMQFWLANEAQGPYQVLDSPGAVVVKFQIIDDAFNFRLQFDDEVII